MEQLIFSLPDFINDNKFPIEYTGRGEDLSPEIVIENLSDNAKTLAVTLEDIRNPIKNYTHWIIWNITAISKTLRIGLFGIFRQQAKSNRQSRKENTFRI